jgi:hypothetical protein
MGIFSRTNRRGQPLLTATSADLSRLGIQAFGGESAHPPGMTSLMGQLDGYALAFQAAAGYPGSETAAEVAAIGQFLQELTAAAEEAGAWGFVGAICVGWNTMAASYRDDPRYLSILDRGLEFLRTDGVSYTAVPPFAMERWTSVHGYGGSRPAGWSSALDNVPVPPLDAPPDVVDLSNGEARLVTQASAAPPNMIYSERRSDGLIYAFIEGPDPDSGAMRRWDWDGVSAPNYPGFLRELGERLVTPNLWVCDDLFPYLPCRSRTREAMRAEARGQAFS